MWKILFNLIIQRQVPYISLERLALYNIFDFLYLLSVFRTTCLHVHLSHEPLSKHELRFGIICRPYQTRFIQLNNSFSRLYSLINNRLSVWYNSNSCSGYFPAFGNNYLRRQHNFPLRREVLQTSIEWLFLLPLLELPFNSLLITKVPP